MIDDLFRGWHVLIVVLAFVLLFGARRLPEGARALGRSLRIFRAEVRGMSSDQPAEPAATAPAVPPIGDPAIDPPVVVEPAAPPVVVPPGRT